MARLGDFLTKQGRFLLEHDTQALIYIALLALIPFTAWLSAAILALITLRKGLSGGFKGLVVAFLALLLQSLMSMSFSAALITSAITFLPCYFTAAVLHFTASWKIAGAFIVFLALVAIVLIHWFFPDFITKQYQYIQTILMELELQHSDSSTMFLLSNKNNKLSQIILANYLLGVQALSVIFSALASLLLARSVQSGVYYPGGFRREMLAFHASSLGVILLVLAAIGAYQQNPLAISSLPVLLAYYVFAGLSLSFYVLAKDKGAGFFVLLVVPLVLLPFVMLPLYVILGALDSLFHFRSYLSTKIDNKDKKG